MTPCVTYTRVSSEEQAKVGYSIPYQGEKIEAFARKNDVVITERFAEAHSARSTGRPEFQKMLDYLAEHHEVRTVLVHKLDRISRNLTDWAFLKETLGVHVVAVEEPASDTPLGRLTQTFGAAIAKFYSENLGQEVRKGMRGCFEAGGCISRAPVGYLNVPRTRTERSKVVLDPVLGPVVHRMFEQYATGEFSLAEMADDLFDHGLRTASGRPYPADRVSRLLRHPFYKGLTRYNGETRLGGHEALVSETLWDQVQKVLTRRGNDHGEKGTRFFLLRGLLYCACGRKMTAETHPRGSYYCCMPDARRDRCPAPYVPMQALDAQVVTLLPVIALTAQGKHEVVEALHCIGEEQKTTREREEAGLRAKEGRLQNKLVKLTDRYAADEIPADAYQRLRTGYEHELAGLRQRLAALSADLTEDIAAIEQLVNTASSVARLYALAATPEDHKTLLRQIFARIVIKDRAINHIEYHPPFSLLFDDSPEAGSGVPLEHALLDYIATRRVE